VTNSAGWKFDRRLGEQVTGSASYPSVPVQQRRRRSELFGADLFADPAWEILLLLFSEQPSREYVKVRDFSITAQLPVTTTLRWLNTLEQRGLIWKKGDDDDRRTTNVGLTKHGVDMMMLYFSS
jgi:DNA-binding MarR family transcriptional regulator